MLKMKRIEHSVLNAKLHQKEAEIVAHAGEPGHVTIATNMAGRGTDIKLKGGVREAGGLAIIGTERHESRRAPSQLGMTTRSGCGSGIITQPATGRLLHTNMTPTIQPKTTSFGENIDTTNGSDGKPVIVVIMAHTSADILP